MAFKANIQCAIFAILVVFIGSVACDSSIPADKSQLTSWFSANVKPYASRKGTLNASLEAAESATPKVITVSKDGSGDFKTVTDALKSIPSKNTARVIINIGPGTYKEKITVNYGQHFVTFYGNPNNRPILTYDATSGSSGGTDNSATVIVNSDFFQAVNIEFQNTAPRPEGKVGGQALALRIWGDKAAIYNCRLIGFQDTLCDDQGSHFYMDTYIEGTVDFIYGDGRSIFLNCIIRVVKDKYLTVATAHGRINEDEDTGFVFVHCTVTGDGTGAYLGRAWGKAPRVYYAYSDIGSCISPDGWSIIFHPEAEKTLDFGEYQNTGSGSSTASRKYGKELTSGEIASYLSLSYIDADKWLLPPQKP